MVKSRPAHLLLLVTLVLFPQQPLALTPSQVQASRFAALIRDDPAFLDTVLRSVPILHKVPAIGAMMNSLESSPLLAGLVSKHLEDPAVFLELDNRIFQNDNNNNNNNKGGWEPSEPQLEFNFKRQSLPDRDVRSALQRALASQQQQLQQPEQLQQQVQQQQLQQQQLLLKQQQQQLQQQLQQQQQQQSQFQDEQHEFQQQQLKLQQQQQHQQQHQLQLQQQLPAPNTTALISTTTKNAGQTAQTVVAIILNAILSVVFVRYYFCNQHGMLGFCNWPGQSPFERLIVKMCCLGGGALLFTSSRQQQSQLVWPGVSCDCNSDFPADSADSPPPTSKQQS